MRGATGVEQRFPCLMFLRACVYGRRQFITTQASVVVPPLPAYNASALYSTDVFHSIQERYRTGNLSQDLAVLQCSRTVRVAHYHTRYMQAPPLPCCPQLRYKDVIRNDRFPRGSE